MKTGKTGKRATKAIEGGENCRKCGRQMQRFEHAGSWQPVPRRDHFLFWDRCNPCRHLQHYEIARVKPDETTLERNIASGGPDMNYSATRSEA